jgi:hypothetical protein
VVFSTTLGMKSFWPMGRSLLVVSARSRSGGCQEAFGLRRPGLRIWTIRPPTTMENIPAIAIKTPMNLNHRRSIMPPAMPSIMPIKVTSTEINVRTCGRTRGGLSSVNAVPHDRQNCWSASTGVPQFGQFIIELYAGVRAIVHCINCGVRNGGPGSISRASGNISVQNRL